jgi:hypothetical protein
MFILNGNYLTLIQTILCHLDPGTLLDLNNNGLDQIFLLLKEL